MSKQTDPILKTMRIGDYGERVSRPTPLEETFNQLKLSLGQDANLYGVICYDTKHGKEHGYDLDRCTFLPGLLMMQREVGDTCLVPEDHIQKLIIYNIKSGRPIDTEGRMQR